VATLVERGLARWRPVLLVLIVSGAMATTLGGCEPQGSDQTPVSPLATDQIPARLPTTNASAVLDWQAASITLPLDRYGMSSAEYQTAMAGASIVYARCVTGSQQVSAEVVAEARRAFEPIVPDPNVIHWLFGVWDAEYVAAHGWYPFPQDPPHPLPVEADPDTSRRCAAIPDYVSLLPITAYGSPDEAFAALLDYSGQAYMRTIQDPRFASLVDQLSACLARAGYTALKTVDGPGPELEEGWTEEQKLEAMLASATCQDNLAMTQQAADIDAAYQAEFIRDHEAELVTIRAEVDRRLAAATQILKDVGAL